METSTNYKLFAEHQTKEATSEEHCRLRYGLNENCLLHIFEYLRVCDLIQVCKLDGYFKELITKWTIKKKLIDLGMVLQHKEPNKYCDTLSETFIDFFQTFGKSIRRFKVFTNNFTFILQTIIKYCEPATLTEVDLELQYYDPHIGAVDMDIVRQSMPFFSNLRKLAFRGNVSDEDFDDDDICTVFMTQISTTASHFEKLKLIDVVVKSGWLNNMHNLRELDLAGKHKSLFSIEGLTSGLRRLKVFKFDAIQDIAPIADALSKHCPDLEEFSDHHSNVKNPYKRVVNVVHRYNFLSSFPYLNSVTLTSYTFCGCDLYYPLIMLATKNIVKLTVFQNASTPIFLSTEEKAQIMRRSLPHFTCLQTVEIKIAFHIGDGNYVSDKDTKWTQCDLRCQFIFHFASQLKNLKCVKFLGCTYTTSNMHKILEFTPNIPTLDMSVLNSVSPEEIQNIVKILRTIRQLNDGQTERRLLHLAVNARGRDYGYCDFEDVMKISFHVTDDEDGVD